MAIYVIESWMVGNKDELKPIDLMLAKDNKNKEITSRLKIKDVDKKCCY